MTEGPSPSQASGSGSVSTENDINSGKLAIPNHPNALPGSSQPYGNYSAWNSTWSSNYSGYAAMTSNPALYAHMVPYTNLMTGYTPHRMTNLPNSYNPNPRLASKSSDKVSSEQSTTSSTKLSTDSSSIPGVADTTPSFRDLEACRHWDKVLGMFLQKTKMNQCLKGLEMDMLVLNSEWEEKVVPDALKELVKGMQVILAHLAGETTQAEEVSHEVAETSPVISPEEQLDERKLSYIRLGSGNKHRTPSSINKSISQFLARSRARNDASNRAEFLHSLAEKKRKLQKETADRSLPESDSTPMSTEVKELASCARVDAKTIDRDKQIKYEIQKNEAGPLTRTRVVKDSPADPINTPSSSNIESAADTPIFPSSSLEDPPRPYKKRRLTTLQKDSVGVPSSRSQSSSKAKRKGRTKKEPSSTIITHKEPSDAEDDGISEAFLAGAQERILNLEDHLSIRYVPSQPRTLFARLKYLEDHLVRLEKEYPPWAALHFNQPNRGWPPPPRATPVIVPPHLRKTETATPPNVSTTADSARPGLPSAPAGTTKGKGRSKNSSLHKAVMDRLEIQHAMNEIGVPKSNGS